MEGLPTGAGTGPAKGIQRQTVVVPPERTQRMGLCSIQKIRVPAEADQPVKEKPGQLWWVAPATEWAIKDMMEGPDVTRQRCSECSFQGTKKRVRIHCIQHFCKYFCDCQLMKASRDAIYDHQVSKHRSEDHGGISRRIYCVDEQNYPAYCAAMGWEDPQSSERPVPLGEASPNLDNPKAPSPPSQEKHQNSAG